MFLATQSVLYLYFYVLQQQPQCYVSAQTCLSGPTALTANLSATTLSDGSEPQNVYSSDLACIWDICTQVRKPYYQVYVTFSRFATEGDYDFLTFYEDNKLIAQFSGFNSFPPNITSSGNCLALRFSSDDTTAYLGWQFTYRIKYTCRPQYYCVINDPASAEAVFVDVLCPGGFYCPGNSDGEGTAISCPAATYCPARSSVPTNCTAGNYCPVSEMSEPLVCPQGFYCPERTHTPIPCPAGSTCPTGSTEPLTCTAGMYCSGSNSIALPCPAGFFCPESSKSPSSCPAGHFCPERSAAPVICEAGSYCPVRNMTTALDCPGGFVYCPEGWNTSLPHCPPGTLSFALDRPSKLSDCADCAPRCNATTSACNAIYQDESQQCFICSEKYYNRGSECERCWDDWVLYVVMSLALGSFVVALIVFQRKRFQMTMLRLTVNFLQVAAIVASVNAAWPTFFRDVYNTVGIDIGSLHVQCLIGHLNITQRAVAQGAGFAGLCMVLLIVAMVLSNLQQLFLKLCCGHAQTERGILRFVQMALVAESYAMYAIRSASLVFLLGVPYMVQMVLSLSFTCSEGERWPEDRSIRCDDTEWMFIPMILCSGLVVVSGVMFVLFVIRIALPKHRHSSWPYFATPAVSNKWHTAFTDSYRPHLWFWDFVIVAYKLVITGVLAFQYHQIAIDSHWPSTICACIMILYGSMVYRSHPFQAETLRNISSNHLRCGTCYSWTLSWLFDGYDAANTGEAIGGFCQALSFSISSLVVVDVLNARIASWVIIGANVLVVLFAVILPILSKIQMTARHLQVDSLSLKELARGMTQSYISFKGFSLEQLNRCQTEFVVRDKLPRVIQHSLLKAQVAIRDARESLIVGKYSLILSDYDRMHTNLQLAHAQLTHLLASLQFADASTGVLFPQLTSDVQFVIRMVQALRFFVPLQARVAQLPEQPQPLYEMDVKTQHESVADTTLTETEPDSQQSSSVWQLNRLRTFAAEAADVELAILHVNSGLKPDVDEDLGCANVLDSRNISVAHFSETLRSECVRRWYGEEAKFSRALITACESYVDENLTCVSNAWKVLRMKLRDQISYALADINEQRIRAAQDNDIATWIKCAVIGQMRMRSLRSILYHRCAYAAAHCGADQRQVVQFAVHLHQFIRSIVPAADVLTQESDDEAIQNMYERLDVLHKDTAKTPDDKKGEEMKWVQQAESTLKLNAYSRALVNLFDAFVDVTDLLPGPGPAVTISTQESDTQNAVATRSSMKIPLPEFLMRMVKRPAEMQQLRHYTRTLRCRKSTLYQPKTRWQDTHWATQRDTSIPTEVPGIHFVSDCSGSDLANDDSVSLLLVHPALRTPNLFVHGIPFAAVQRLARKHESPAAAASNSATHDIVPEFANCRELLRQLNIEPDRVQPLWYFMWLLTCVRIARPNEFILADGLRREYQTWWGRSFTFLIKFIIVLLFGWILIPLMFLHDITIFAKTRFYQYCCDSRCGASGNIILRKLDRPLDSDALYKAASRHIRMYYSNNMDLAGRKKYDHSHENGRCESVTGKETQYVAVLRAIRDQGDRVQQPLLPEQDAL
jgi:CUB domain